MITQHQTEKEALQSQLEKGCQQTEQLVAELEDSRSQCFTSQADLKQLNQLYQQSQSELEQARECLQTAEQTLQSRVAEVAAPEHQQNIEATDDASRSRELPRGTGSSRRLCRRAALPGREIPMRSRQWTPEEEAAPVEPVEPVEAFTPPSFIDQYQHLLEEDGPSTEVACAVAGRATAFCR